MKQKKVPGNLWAIREYETRRMQGEIHKLEDRVETERQLRLEQVAFWRDRMADCLELLVQEQQKSRLAYESPVTDLPNRHYFNEELKKRVQRAEDVENFKPFALILIDLNNFKPVNDLIGHSVGDEVLRIFGNKLRDQTRTQQSVAREKDKPAHLTTHWGGDEFAIILEDVSNPNEVGAVIDRLANKVKVGAEDLPELAALSQPVTASYGFACYQPGISAQELFDMADEGLYSSKDSRP